MTEKVRTIEKDTLNEVRKQRKHICFCGDETALMELMKDERKCLCCAYGERLAMIRECVSVNSLYDPRYTEEAESCIAASEYIVLYGVEKMSAREFDTFAEFVFSSNENVTLILSGDFRTRVSCAANEYSSARDSEHWKRLAFVTVELEREDADTELQRAIELIADGDFSGAEWINEHCLKVRDRDAVRVTSTNSAAAIINEACKDNALKEYVYPEGLASGNVKAKIEGEIDESDTPIPLSMYVHEYQQMMTVIFPHQESPYKAGGYIGSLHLHEPDMFMLSIKKLELNIYFARVAFEKRVPQYCVNEFGEGEVGSRTVGRIIQYPMIPANAASLEQTDRILLDKVEIDPTTTMQGELCALLSRCRSVEGIYLTRPIRPEDLKADK